MVPNLARKIFGIVFLALLTVWSLLTFKINLGLDLQGGSRVVYDLNIDQAIEDGLVSEFEDREQIRSDIIQVFLRRLDGTGVADVPIYPQGEESVVIELPGMDEEAVDLVKRTLRNQGSLQFRVVLEAQDDLNHQEEVTKFRTWRAANPEADAWSFNGVPESAGGPRRGVLWYPIADKVLQSDPEQASYLASLGVAEFNAVPVRSEDAIRGTEPSLGSSWDFSGAMLQYVGPSQDQFGRPAVRFQFQELHKSAFYDFTDQFTGRAMAIVLNNEVHSAPNIQEAMRGEGIIQGGNQGFSQDEMRELITVLRTGSLRLIPELESESFVGPNLGKDSIRIGIWSSVIGAALIFLFMIFYYRLNGVVACLALLFNGFLLIGAMSFTQATMTLPGLAGLVLTLGMAVDANILIYERMREERNRGRETPQAYKNGFDEALSAIVDGNLTTLITSVILFKVGTGPVQGFAAVLSLGILTTLFSSLVFSKVILHFLVFGKKPVITEVKMLRLLPRTTSFKFLKWGRPAMIASTMAILLGLGGFALHGSQMLGIDFTGGSIARVNLARGTSLTEIRGLLPGYTVTELIAPGQAAAGAGVQSILVKLSRTHAIGAQGEQVEDLGTFIEQDLRQRLGDRLSADDPFPEVNTVGERVSGEIQQRAVQAIVLSLIAIIIYMNFRFKEYRYGIAAVVAVLHDVLITLGVLTLVHYLGIVEVEIDLTIIAAFLTIIGYSLNDTIVIFDRIRENLPRRSGTYQEIIDLSLNQTLSRTFLTSMTVFFVVAVLFFANRATHNVLEGFAFAMIVGVISGTYSTLYIATPLLVYLDRWARKHRVLPASGKEGALTKKPVAAS